MIKFYDTSSLLLMPDEILNNKIAISSITLQELESIKTNPKKDIDVKAMARKLSVLLDDGSIKYDVQFYNSKAQKIAEGFDIEITPDAKILACAIAYAKSLSEKVAFVTNDICLKNFAKELTDLPVESVNDEDDYVGYEEVFLNADELGDLYEDLTHDPFDLYNGEYLIVCDEDGNEIDRMCKTPSGFRRIRYTSFTSEAFNKVEPYKGDVYQALAMDSLVSNQVTMLKGPAGSGKTTLALSYLFHLLEYGDIDKIIIFCNTIATRDAAKLGYYPGEKDEKLLDSQIGNVLASKLGSKEEVIGMINREELLLLPMSDIRGFDTSGMRAGVYITEAQNMSIDLMKLALQRLGEDCKMILDGDSKAQVDLAAYEGANNGMKRASKIFRGTNVYGEVELGIIHRSEVARIAENM